VRFNMFLNAFRASRAAVTLEATSSELECQPSSSSVQFDEVALWSGVQYVHGCTCVIIINFGSETEMRVVRKLLRESIAN